MKLKTSIPEWFSLDDYENLKYMNRNQWRLVWLYRLHAYEYLKNGKENFFSVNQETISEFPLDIKNNVFRDDLISSDDSIHELGDFFIFFIYELAKIWGNDEFIKVLDDVGKYVEESKEKKEKKENIEDIWDEVSISDYEELELDNSKMMEEINKHLGLIISIDTHFSDEAIFKQFKEILSSYRKKRRENGKIISESEIKSLIEYKVIPYIDLMLWGMITGKKIRDQEIADVLFPDEYDISRIDTVRQTVKKKALKLLSHSSPKFI
ncbi:DUF6387 family protein [Avibacterium sp. 21-586]|uniref:DUF6387 family protein n=1 Tax=Avibacterium sp. 21-586 TaxID=2911534 RepID=UPI002245C1EA|nr:DUF6387 family protein [Avibacterium sp. 21-586]MCW9709821.1 DUF6387 family protein [Avibacterium sp. 21-586]